MREANFILAMLAMIRVVPTRATHGWLLRPHGSSYNCNMGQMQECRVVVSDGVWKVETALRAAVGGRANELMHSRSKHLGNLTPHEVARAPNGHRIVLAELNKIALQSLRERG
jgi:hypothetical protein